MKYALVFLRGGVQVACPHADNENWGRRGVETTLYTTRN